MKTALAALILCLALTGCVQRKSSKVRRSERDYQREWCLKRGGRMEVRMKDGTRCDCLTSRHAVEFDFAPKWAEAVGQSLNYARQSGKHAGIVLICRKVSDVEKLRSLRGVVRFYKLPVKVWSVNCN